jgi:hypothetical protein
MIGVIPQWKDNFGIGQEKIPGVALLEAQHRLFGPDRRIESIQQPQHRFLKKSLAGEDQKLSGF